MTAAEIDAAKAAEARGLLGATVRLIDQPGTHSGWAGREGALERSPSYPHCNRLGVRVSPGCVVMLSYPFRDDFEVIAQPEKGNPSV